MILIIIEIILGIILTAIFIQVSLKVKDLERKKRGEGFITIRDWIDPHMPKTIVWEVSLSLSDMENFNNNPELHEIEDYVKDEFLKILPKVKLVRDNVDLQLCVVANHVIGNAQIRIYPNDTEYFDMLNTTNYKLEKPLVINNNKKE